MNIRDLAAMIQQMKPGQCCRVSMDTFRTLDVGMMENSHDFPLKDWVLENIIGSSYEYGYNEDLATGDINYFRLSEPLTNGRRSYVSPDRLSFYRRRPDGIYESIRSEA